MKSLPNYSAWLGAAVFGGLTALGAHAQSFPSKPITFVLSITAGGGTDVIARTIGNVITKSTGQPVIVEYRPGAGGIVAHEYVARKTPDGYTYLFSSQSAMVLATGMNPPPPYDTARDFAPVTMYLKFPYFLAVPARSQAGNIREFVSLAKAQSGRMALGASQSPGYIVTAEGLKQRLGLDLPLITYKGAAPGLTDLIGGQIQAMIVDPPSAVPHLNSGAIKALAVTSKERVAAFPDVPTFSETVVPGYESISWGGIVTTAGAPREAIERMNTEFGKALKAEEVLKLFANLAVPPWHTSPQEMANIIREELLTLPAMVRKLNITGG